MDPLVTRVESPVKRVGGDVTAQRNLYDLDSRPPQRSLSEKYPSTEEENGEKKEGPCTCPTNFQ